MFANQSQTNITVGKELQSLVSLVLFSLLSTVPCCVFLFINGTLLFTLRSKPVFCETARYVLLYNLLFADTVLLAHSQLMYLIAACRIRLTYPVCGFLSMMGGLISVISPLTLMMMSVERYVAVCYPLRHAAIITVRNTGVAILLVWTFSSLNVLTQVFLLLEFPFAELESLQMEDFCGKESLLLNPVSDLYEKAFTYSVFISAGVTVTCSYIGVMVAARSASTDRASAQKARNTLLLHLLQLGLTLFSTMHNSLLLAISMILDRITLISIQCFLYIFVIILPRCLSTLIYGLRDQAIRPVLIYHLCCHQKHSTVLSEKAKAKICILITS
ncbi:odorant receptor 131-2-like [Echeneis naucrates]|uniref:odorant receptor 131-2-like n=1 Tax=Echeneis naucrates TaxID=173247 RepID=UPI001113AD45|nr:odorant receptor 131-2-like [Echeneis naucrates]